MEKTRVKLVKLKEKAMVPSYGSDEAAGADLYACLDAPAAISPGETKMIGTGIALEIPRGYAGLIYARSGLALKKGVAPANKVGVVDSDYRGEIIVSLHNHSASQVTIEPGERIAQMVITPYLTAEFIEAKELSGTRRGEGGFGSTGSR